MTRALVLETSGRLGSVALAAGGDVLAEDRFAHGLQHAAEIIPRIDDLCRKQRWTPRDIEAVYVSTGPGSFTGLRIGVTLAKTFAMATGARLVSVSSARVLAGNAPVEARHVVIVLDAKREQVFTARLTRSTGGESSGGGAGGVGAGEDEWTFEEEPHLASLAAALARAPRPVHLIGEGIPYHQKFIPDDDAGVISTPPESWVARACVVARLGHALARAGRFTEPDALLPAYIRKPEAEEKWEAAQAAAVAAVRTGTPAVPRLPSSDSQAPAK